ncbi:MAG: LytTR family DNA-binding domain-containing protein [Pseudomonadota bacterium]
MTTAINPAHEKRREGVATDASKRRQGAALLAATTLGLWLALVFLFGGFSYVDAMRAGTDVSLFRSLAIYGLGFAPWLLLGPAVFRAARRHANAAQASATFLSQAAIIFAAAFGAIFTYFLTVYAPVTGMTAGEAVSSTRLIQWAPDILIFIIVFLAGWRSGSNEAAPQTEDNARIAVRSQGRVDYVPVNEIIAGSAQGNYVALEVRDGEHLYRGGISDLAERLGPFGLLRVHRSHFIRSDYVLSTKMKGSTVQAVRLANGKEIPVSAQYEAALRDALSDAVIHSD